MCTAPSAWRGASSTPESHRALVIIRHHQPSLLGPIPARDTRLEVRKYAPQVRFERGAFFFCEPPVPFLGHLFGKTKKGMAKRFILHGPLHRDDATIAGRADPADVAPILEASSMLVSVDFPSEVRLASSWIGRSSSATTRTECGLCRVDLVDAKTA